MDLQKVQEFIVFSGYMNFTTASAALHMSQSALSKHIKEIEQEIGVELVTRGGINEQNTITPAGQRFLVRSQGLLKDYDRIIDECRGIGTRPQKAQIHSLFFALGMTDQIAAAFERQGEHDGSDCFEFKKFDSDIRTALDDSVVDFAVHYEPYPEMIGFGSEKDRAVYGNLSLAPERIRFLIRSDNPLAGSDSASLADLEAYNVVNEYSASYKSWYIALDRIFGKQGFPIKWKLLAEDPRKSYSLTLEEDDICMCTEHYANVSHGVAPEATRIVSVRDFDPIIYPFLIYRHDNCNPNVEKIVTCMNAVRYPESECSTCGDLALSGSETASATATIDQRTSADAESPAPQSHEQANQQCDMDVTGTISTGATVGADKGSNYIRFVIDVDDGDKSNSMPTRIACILTGNDITSMRQLYTRGTHVHVSGNMILTKLRKELNPREFLRIESIEML